MANPASDELTLEIRRVIAAPARLVFDAWSDPAHVRAWFGPEGWPLTMCEMDFRPGGAWRYVLRKPNGKEYGFRGTFVEIVPPEWFSWMFGVERMPGEGLEVFRFSEHDGKTTLTTTSHFPSIEVRDAVIASGMETGAAELFDRLEGYLTTMRLS